MRNRADWIIVVTALMFVLAAFCGLRRACGGEVLLAWTMPTENENGTPLKDLASCTAMVSGARQASRFKRLAKALLASSTGFIWR